MLGKCEPLSHYVLVKHAVLIYRVAIYSVRSVRLHKYEVGLIAGTYETAALYLI